MNTRTTVNELLVNVGNKTRIEIYDDVNSTTPTFTFDNKYGVTPLIGESLYYTCDHVSQFGERTLRIYLEG